MARCGYPGCDWKGKKAGLAIHQAKAHGIHPVHDFEVPDPLGELERSLRAEVQSTVMCPVPGCRSEIVALEPHLEAKHGDWRRSDGRWVFEG